MASTSDGCVRCARLVGLGLVAAGAIMGANPAPAQDTTARPLRWAGDLRLRGEWDVDRVSQPDRARGRVRFRLGLEKELSARVLAGARLATVPERRDPNSTHQTLGNGFQAFSVALDRAFVRWKPTERAPLMVYAGKFGHAFVEAPISGELLWDADIQPEGVALVAGPARGLRVMAGEYLVLHRSPGKTVGLTTGQALWQGRRGKLVASAAFGVYAYQRPDAGGAAFLARENQGNALVIGPAGDTTAFASGFVLLHGFTSLEYSGLPLPALVGFQYVRNTDAAPGFDDDGFAVGGQVGKLDRPGDWRAYYQYQELGREAVFSAFAQDDFLQATNLRAHLAGVYLQILSRANAHLWMLWSAAQAPRAGEFQKRFRLDLTFAF